MVELISERPETTPGASHFHSTGKTRLARAGWYSLVDPFAGSLLFRARRLKAGRGAFGAQGSSNISDSRNCGRREDSDPTPTIRSDDTRCVCQPRFSNAKPALTCCADH